MKEVGILGLDRIMVLVRTRCRSKKGRIIETLFRVCSGKIIYLRQEQPEVGRETENKIIHFKIP